jgi:hypothetical protein
MPLLTGNEEPIHIDASNRERADWCKILVSFVVPKLAQRRYAGMVGDSMCEHDDLIVNRVLSSISRSLEDERRMRAQIEEEAENFVNTYWGEILLVARALFKHGRLDRQQIAHILRALPTKIALNQTGIDYASDLIAAGKVNWAGGVVAEQIVGRYRGPERAEFSTKKVAWVLRRRRANILAD